MAHIDITRYRAEIWWHRVADGDLPEQGALCLIIKDGYYEVAQLYVWTSDKPMWLINGMTYECSPFDLWTELPMEKEVCALFD